MIESSIAYKYDTFNRRVEKIVHSVSTTCLYYGLNIAAVRDGSGAVSAWYVYGLSVDEPLALIDNATSPGTIHYYHTDILGSVVALTNSAGAVTTRYNYSPYGVTEVTGTDAIGNAQPLRFTAREWYAETGMYYYRNRYYSPEFGRFISEDSLRFGAGDVNWYAYVSGNPVNYVDPLGLTSYDPYDIYEEASQSAARNYPDANSLHNGLGDAYRHCLGSCLMTKDMGSGTAALLGWANEVKGDVKHNQPENERNMDEYNNKIGRICGRKSKDREYCFEGCLKLANSGHLKTINDSFHKRYY